MGTAPTSELQTPLALFRDPPSEHNSVTMRSSMVVAAALLALLAARAHSGTIPAQSECTDRDGESVPVGGTTYFGTDGCRCTCTENGPDCDTNDCYIFLEVAQNISCSYNGKVYEHGVSFGCSDGCNSCGCSNGAVWSTMMMCTVYTEDETPVAPQDVIPN